MYLPRVLAEKAELITTASTAKTADGRKVDAMTTQWRGTCGCDYCVTLNLAMIGHLYQFDTGYIIS